ncbi:hypothetical protein QJS10_CPA06g00941 [Acorus calamus]|uniref:Uncharacterized protein n=1 Tax=Acorus calamus TaxID=4465 RepID=A0AAV9EIC7_ACOCL|nr:hypothetical protein QJS10_CPA06g00941 [Acorus calamus]
MAITLSHSFGLRRLHSRQHLFIRASSSSTAAIENPENAPQSPTTAAAAPPSFFPKRGQTVELVCESLAFKGKGLCRVAETGFVVGAQTALIEEMENLLDVAETLVVEKELRVTRSLLELPVWGSLRYLVAALANGGEEDDSD